MPAVPQKCDLASVIHTLITSRQYGTSFENGQETSVGQQYSRILTEDSMVFSWNSDSACDPSRLGQALETL